MKVHGGEMYGTILLINSCLRWWKRWNLTKESHIRHIHIAKWDNGWFHDPSILTVEMGNGWKCLFPQTSILNVPFFMFCVRFLVKIYVKSVLFGFVVWMHEQKLQGLPFPENKLDHTILPSASCWPFLPTNHGSEKKVPPSIRLKRHQFLLNHDGRNR